MEWCSRTSDTAFGHSTPSKTARSSAVPIDRVVRSPRRRAAATPAGRPCSRRDTLPHGPQQPGPNGQHALESGFPASIGIRGICREAGRVSMPPSSVYNLGLFGCPLRYRRQVRQGRCDARTRALARFGQSSWCRRSRTAWTTIGVFRHSDAQLA